METKRNDIAAENQALRNEIRLLKMENARIIGQLDFLRAMYGLPTYEDEQAQKSQQAVCKIISINPLNR